jgi:methionyl-tRNA formyltransferase
MNIIFFGSFLEYSVEVLKGLMSDAGDHAGVDADAGADTGEYTDNDVSDDAYDHATSKAGGSHSEPINVIAVVTTPPMPAGRKQELQYTNVHEYANSKNIPVFAPEKLTPEALSELAQFGECDYFVTAGYGKLLPVSWLEYPRLAALNVHFSLLPKYRGANPGEWAILSGETETGISVIEMSAQFDTGAVVAQAKIPITEQDTRETLYQQLYALAGETIQEVLQTDFIWRTQETLIKSASNSMLTFSYPPVEQTTSPTPYARRLTKDDSWISAKVLSLVVDGRGKGVEKNEGNGEKNEGKDEEKGEAGSERKSESEKKGEAGSERKSESEKKDEKKSEEKDENNGKKLSEDDLSPFLYFIYVEQWQSQEKSLAMFIEYAVRALTGFPCIWTTVQTNKGEKRLKIFSGKLSSTAAFIPEIVQIEGQRKAQWKQIKNSVKFSE